MELIKKDVTVAERFYEEVVFPKIMEFIFSKRNTILQELKDKWGIKEVRGLIQVVGLSKEPLLLIQKVFQPEKTYFICTESSKNIMDKIVSYFNLLPSQVQHYTVSRSTTPEDTYRIVRRALLEFFKNSHEVLIDISGGKKSIMSGALLAGYYFNLPVVYVDYREYLPKIGKPVPFSEYIHIFEKPQLVLTDIEERKLLATLKNYDFSGMINISEELMKRSADPRRFEIYNLLAKGFSEWDNFDHRSALEFFDSAKNKARQYKFRITNERRIDDYIDVLTLMTKDVPKENKEEYILKKDKLSALYAIDLIQNAERRKNNQKYDFSVLLMYRALELIIQRLLMKFGLNPKEPDFEKFCGINNINLQELKENVHSIRKELYGLKGNEYMKKESSLPSRISLMDGLIILKAIKVPEIEEINLSKIYSFIEKRNRSILAHGLSKVSGSDCRKFFQFFKKTIEQILNKLYPEWKEYADKLKMRTDDIRIIEKS